MITQHKAGSRAVSFPSGLAVGAAVSIAVTIFVCVAGAWLISAEVMPQEQIGYCAVTALLAAAITGGLTACGKIQRQKMIVCLLSGGLYYLILAVVTITFFGGDFRGMGVTFLTVLLGSVTAILLATGRKKQGRGVGRKKISR